MNILSIPYITGGLSHFIPSYVLNHKLKNNNITNYFLVNNGVQKFLTIKNIPFVPTNYTLDCKLIESLDASTMNESILQMEKEAFEMKFNKVYVCHISLKYHYNFICIWP